MRIWLILLIVTLMLVGCQGSESALPEQKSPETAFAGLPSPAAIKAMDTSPRSGKQVSMYTEFDGHQWDPALAHSDNVTAIPSGIQSLMGGRKTPLTYCVFRVAPLIIPDGAPIQDIYVSAYYAVEPVAPDGLYVGYSDFNTNSWRWLGPQSSNQTYDGFNPPLTGAAGPEYIVIVNYSEVECSFYEIHLSIPTMNVGVDWIYYTAAPAFPGEPRGINRVRTFPSTPEPVKTGIMLDGYRSPEVRYMPGGDRLYYTKEQGANGGIYWSDMEGSGETDHRIYDSLHILDWDITGNIEFYIQGYGTATPGGWWYNWSTSGGVSVEPANGYIFDACIDSFQTVNDRAVFLGLTQAVPVNHGLYWAGFDALPFSGDADICADNGTENVKSLTYSRYLFANGEYREGCYFVSDGRNPYDPADTTGNIYYFDPVAAEVKPYLVDDAYDFGGIVFAPDGKWGVIAVREPGDPYYDLNLIAATYPENWPAFDPIVEDDCWGDLEWYYDITP